MPHSSVVLRRPAAALIWLGVAGGEREGPCTVCAHARFSPPAGPACTPRLWHHLVGASQSHRHFARPRRTPRTDPPPLRTSCWRSWTTGKPRFRTGGWIAIFGVQGLKACRQVVTDEIPLSTSLSDSDSSLSIAPLPLPPLLSSALFRLVGARPPCWKPRSWSLPAPTPPPPHRLR